MKKHANSLSIVTGLVAILDCHPIMDGSASFGSDPSSQSSPDAGSGPGSGDVCPPEDCGLNCIQLADMRFGPLSLDGEPNQRGFAILGLVAADGRHLALDIQDSAFVGVEPGPGAPVVQDAGLIGSKIVVAQRHDDGVSTEWVLSIRGVVEVPFLSREQGSFPVYELTYAPADSPGEDKPLCRSGSSVAVIAGESYDFDTLAADTRRGGRWFSMACSDHLLWKAMRMSYAPGRSENDPYHTTPAQRRATLAMLAGDYCGDGSRFTRPGTPLYWQNQAGWMDKHTPAGRAARVEAGWDESGVTCLDAPRLVDRYTRADIEDACGRPIPACTPEILEASEWITSIPQSAEPAEVMAQDPDASFAATR